MDSTKSTRTTRTHNYRTLTFALLCVLFVSHGLLVLGHDPWLSDQAPDTVDDDDFIDFTDMVNYDPVTKQMMNKKEKVKMQAKGACDCDEYQRAIHKCREDLNMCEKVKTKCEAETPPMETSPKDACSGEEMFFKRFARFIVDKLAEQDDIDGEIEAKISVSLSPSSWRILKDFVYSKKGRMAEAYDELTEMVAYVDHANSTTFTMWMEDWLQMDRTSIKVVFYVTILAIVFVMFETRTHLSWLQQLWTLIIIFILISIFWNWLFLYKKEVAKRMAQMNREPPEHCLTGKMTIWDTVAESLRSRLTFNEDPCKLYNEQILVDPLSEVPPTKAIAETFATLFLDPLKHLGKALAAFNHELFANLPLQAWIPALLSVYGGIAVALYICMHCMWNYTREPRVIYQQVEVPVPMVQGQPQGALEMGPLPGLLAREDEERIEEMAYQNPEPQTRGVQDVRRRPPRPSSSRPRRVSDRQDDADNSSSPQRHSSSRTRRSSDNKEDGAFHVEPVASVIKSQEGTFQARHRQIDSTDSEDYNVLQKSDEPRTRRRTHKRSVSPPKVSTQSISGQRSSEGGSPMSHPESQQSSIDQQSLMRSVDSTTVLVSSARHMPPPSSLEDMGGGQASLPQEGGNHSSDGSTPTLSPPQCNTPSSVSVIGDEASLTSSDETHDTRPALERVSLSVSGELEPEVLGAEAGSMSGREGSHEDDDDFEVLHKEQLPQPELN